MEEITASTWLLLGADDNENRRPVHGMRLAFQAEADGFSGAVIGWSTGERLPLASVRYDGASLEFQLKPGKNSPPEMPTFKAQSVGDRFEGYWFDSAGNRLATPKLKIVRYRV